MLGDARPVPLAAAFAATFVLIGLLTRLWAVSLRLLGHPVPDRELALATARALPARYVPLGVSFAVGRVALLRAAGVPLAPLSITAALEMIVHLAVALTLGLALLAVSGGLTAGLTAVAAVAAVAAAAASPAVAGRIISRAGDPPRCRPDRHLEGIRPARGCRCGLLGVGFRHVRALPAGVPGR